MGLAFVFAAGAPSSASAAAEPLPQEVLDHIDDVQAYVEDGGIPANRNPVACSEVCVSLRASEEAVATTTRTAGIGFLGEGWALRSTLWLLPTRLPEAQLGIGVFAVGWQIGTGIRTLYVNEPVPEPSGVVDHAGFVVKGQTILGTGGGSIYAPAMGLVAEQGHSTLVWTTWTGTCNSTPPPLAPVGTESFEPLALTGGCSWAPYQGSITHTVYFKAAAPDPPQPYTGQTTNGVVNFPDYNAIANNPTVARVKSWLLDQLQNHPENYRKLIAWLDYELGVPGAADPFSDHFNMPDCRGLASSECADRLTALGASAVGEQTVADEDAQLEQQPGRVTDTEPTYGAHVLPDDDLTVYANPDPLPAMTATETAVADALATDNPATVNDTNKKTLARACVRRVVAAGDDPNKCNSLPVFFTGRDARAAAVHDIHALTAVNPSWVALNRRTVGDNSRWYVNQPGCLIAEKPDGANCDEYPFWSTMQGKDGALQTLQPDLAWIGGVQNQLQGRKLGKFYGDAAAGDWPAGCNVPADTPDAPFLAIPLPPVVSLDTTWTCNP